MEDNEKYRKPHYPRRNAPFRPPPGVQKAMQNFGVKDLREILDKKQQEKFEDDKRPEPKENRPPPDPSYNYLKDPIRDVSVQPQEKHHLPKGGHQRPRNEDFPRRGPPRNQDHQANSERHPSTPPSVDDKEGRASKKELRFMDPVDDDKPKDLRGEKSNFRPRNHRREHNARYAEPREERLENLVNIKVELSTETGQRNCVLDESTKIPDIKYASDQIPFQKPSKGSRGRGYFRGRGRGRGSFRGRRETANRNNSSETKDIEKQSDVDNSEVGSAEGPQNNPDEEPENTETEEFVDSNEIYEEFPNAYAESGPNNAEVSEEVTAPFDAALVETITITSQKFQDGDVQRSVEVIPTSENGSNENREESIN